jgi:cysteine-rich repeat protein
VEPPGEQCDSISGCSDETCQPLPGFTCLGSGAKPAAEEATGAAIRCAICGDGKINGFEACDPGPGGASSLLCTSTCAKTSPDVTCSATTGQCSLCGNGVIEAGELCDDGNKVGKDGCSATCRTETGSHCYGAPGDKSLCFGFSLTAMNPDTLDSSGSGSSSSVGVAPTLIIVFGVLGGVSVLFGLICVSVVSRRRALKAAGGVGPAGDHSALTAPGAGGRGMLMISAPTPAPNRYAATYGAKPIPPLFGGGGSAGGSTEMYTFSPERTAPRSAAFDPSWLPSNPDSAAGADGSGADPQGGVGAEIRAEARAEADHAAERLGNRESADHAISHGPRRDRPRRALPGF